MSSEPATRISYIAVAGFATVVGGLLLPKAMFHSLDRGLIVWLMACIASGVIVSNVERLSLWRGIKAAMAVSGLFWLTVVLFYVVRWLISRIIHIEAPQILVPFGSGASVDLLDPEVFPLVAILLLIFWIGSTAVVAFTTLSGRLLTAGALKLYKFGPEGLDRVRKIVVAIAGVVAAILALWAAFS